MGCALVTATNVISSQARPLRPAAPEIRSWISGSDAVTLSSYVEVIIYEYFLKQPYVPLEKKDPAGHAGGVISEDHWAS